MLTDLQPAQQAAAIVMILGGAARELVRSITPDEIMHGGGVKGVQVDPVTYIEAGFQNRFALLDDEHRLAAMTQCWHSHDVTENQSTARWHDMKWYVSEPIEKVTW